MAAIAVPTLVLLALGLQSIARQRAAVETLERANLALQAERLAAEVEARLAEAVAAPLRDPLFEELARALAGDPPEALVAAAEIVERLLQRHPVAAQVLVAAEGSVWWPAHLAPLPVAPVQLLARHAPAAASRFEPLFTRAEALELRAGAPHLAAPLYRKVAEATASPTLQALAMSRLARSELRAGRRAEAHALWRDIASRFGDAYDPYSQPYGVVAALALADAVDEPGAVHADLQRAYDSLVHGRWALSAEQAEYFLTVLEQRLGADPAGRPPTRFLATIDFAEALSEWFSGRGDPGNAQIVAGTAGRDRRYDVYYTSPAGSRRQIGIAVDPAWLTREIVEPTRRELNIAGVATLERGARESTAGAARARFRHALPAWDVVLAGGSTVAGGQQVLFAGVTLLVVLVLGLGVVLLLRDVNRERQTTQLHGAFVSGVSHDLKTPLTLVRLYTESLADRSEPPPDERRGFYDIILRETERLTLMVDRVLSFSKAESGARQYTLAHGCIVDVVAATLEQYGPYLRRQGFQYRIDLEDPVPPSLLDASAVTEALVNLLDNAVKYSGGAREIVVRVCGRGDRAVVEVADRGVGIAAADRARIFDRFYRSARNDGQGGYGLGLFLVKNVMNAHHGDVEIDSEVGQGSRFRLVFPPAGS
jgi:signal transduction histidine kinase